MCQRTHLWCAGVPRLDQRRRQESVPEALYVNACCPSQLLSANQVTQRWTLTSPRDLPPTFFTYKPPRADRWTDRQRQTSVNELTERIEAGYPQSAQRGWIRRDRVRRCREQNVLSACVLPHVISLNPFSFHQLYTFKVLNYFCQGKCIYAVQFMEGIESDVK